jgi:hypothetical protein
MPEAAMPEPPPYTPADADARAATGAKKRNDACAVFLSGDEKRLYQGRCWSARGGRARRGRESPAEVCAGVVVITDANVYFVADGVAGRSYTIRIRDVASVRESSRSAASSVVNVSTKRGRGAEFTFDDGTDAYRALHAALSQWSYSVSARASMRRYATPEQAARVRASYGNRCASCGVSGDAPGVAFEMDHIVEWSRGGLTVDENLQPLCVPCHKRKTRAAQ